MSPPQHHLHVKVCVLRRICTNHRPSAVVATEPTSILIRELLKASGANVRSTCQCTVASHPQQEPVDVKAAGRKRKR